MQNIFINDVLVGSIRNDELDQLKLQAKTMPNRNVQQIVNLLKCAGRFLLSVIKTAPVFYPFFIVMFAVRYLDQNMSVTGGMLLNLVLASLLASLGASFLLAILAIPRVKYGYINVAKEEFYKLLRIRLGIPATGIITQSEYIDGVK